MCGDDAAEEAALPVTAAPPDDFPWHLGIFDAHNHIGERAKTAEDILNMKSRCVAVMATRTQDQPLVHSIASTMGLTEMAQLRQDGLTTVVPGFGRHPWFSHELYDDASLQPTYRVDPTATETEMEEAKADHYRAVLSPPPTDPAFTAGLPVPLPLSGFVHQTRERLQAHPFGMIGEIGLDRPFRLAVHWEPGAREAKEQADPTRTPGGRMQRPLSKHSITLDHQKAVFVAQLKLAGEMQRAVSVHGVQVHGVLFDLLVESWKGYEKKGKARSKAQQAAQKAKATEDGSLPFPPRICLHSFSGKADAVRQYLNPKFPSDIYFSFSKSNNMRDETGRAKMASAVQMVPGDRILVESDIHTAGLRMDSELEETYRAVCEMKGWAVEEGVQKIADNWYKFIGG